MWRRDQVAAAVVFAAAGAFSRFSFRHFETRWQIAIFWGAAIAYQAIVLPAVGRRGSPGGFGLDAMCAAVAIVCMKMRIEGIPVR